MAAVVAQVGGVGGGEFVYAQPQVQQQAGGCGGAQAGGPGVGVGGGEERAGLGAVEPDGGGVVGVDAGAADRGGGVRGEEVVGDEVVVELVSAESRRAVLEAAAPWSSRWRTQRSTCTRRAASTSTWSLCSQWSQAVRSRA